jgi:hypothetical protein
MNIGIAKRSASFVLSLLALVATAVSADESGAGPGLDGCLAAALKERPGFVHAWKEMQGSEERYQVSIVNSKGKIADTLCIASAPGNFKFDDRIGTRRYETYARIAVPEESARRTVPLVFVGPVRVWQMEIDLNWMGKPAYEYHMVLPSGREVVAQVDAVTGVLIHAELLPE